MSNQDSLAVLPSDKLPIDKRFHEGLCLAAGGDYERASAAFLDCVIADPSCGEYVQEFVGNLRRRPEPGTADKNIGPAAEAVQRAAAQSDWTEVLQRGPRALLEQPRNLPALLALADASAAQGYSEAEACYVRAVVGAAAEDAPIQRWGGAALGRLHEYDDAIGCWRRVEALDPSDEEAPDSIAALIIARSRRRAGLKDAGRADLQPGRSGANGRDLGAISHAHPAARSRDPRAAVDPRAVSPTRRAISR